MKDNHGEKYDIKITTRDRLLRAWETTAELARTFKIYSEHTDDSEPAKKALESAAISAGEHAAVFLDMLQEYGENR